MISQGRYSISRLGDERRRGSVRGYDVTDTSSIPVDLLAMSSRRRSSRPLIPSSPSVSSLSYLPYSRLINCLNQSSSRPTHQISLKNMKFDEPDTTDTNALLTDHPITTRKKTSLTSRFLDDKRSLSHPFIHLFSLYVINGALVLALVWSLQRECVDPSLRIYCKSTHVSISS